MSELVTITSYSEPLEAHIVKGRLEAEGIPTFIANEHHISAAWYLSNALGGVKIQVHKQDHAKAINIIGLLHDGQFEEELKKETKVTYVLIVALLPIQVNFHYQCYYLSGYH